MRIGIGLPVDFPGISGDTLIEWMKRVDDSRFDTIAVVDEVVSDTYDGLTILSAAAATTSRPRLMTTVIAGPLRSPALLAKQAASIDALSGGRLSLGLGVGDIVDDFAAVGVDLHGRGERFDEQLGQMKRIWSGEPMASNGQAIGPAPVQSDGPELLIGGWAKRALDRIGRFADGYVGAVLSEEMITDEHYRLAERSWHENGRPGKPRFVQNVYFALGPNADGMVSDYVSRDDYFTDSGLGQGIIEATPTTESGVRQMLERLGSTGVDEVIFHPVSPDIEQMERLEQALG